MAWKNDNSKFRKFHSGLRLIPAIVLLSCAIFLATASDAVSAPSGGCATRERDQSSDGTSPTAPEFKVQPLFGGRYRDGDWATLEVKLHNGPQPFQGEVCAILPYSPDNNYSFNRAINLAPGADARFFLYILPSRFEPRYDVMLYNNLGQPVGQDSVRLQLTGTADYTVAVLSDPDKLGPNYLPKAGLLRMRQSSLRLVFVPVSPADVPDRSSGLNTFDAFLLGNLDPARLTPVQWRSLMGWVGEGGQLWLSGGPSFANLVGALDPATGPANTQGTLQLSRITARHLPDTLLPAASLFNGQKLTVQNLLVQPGAVVATRQEGNEADGLPLVVGKTLGRGSIVASAFDLLAAPFTDLTEVSSRYWGAVAEAANPGPDYTNLKQDLFGQPAISRQLASAPGQDLPDPLWLIFGMIAYIVVTVPGCYLILTKLERPLLALVVAPALAFIVAGGVWWLGTAISAKPVHLNRVGVVSFNGDNTPVGIKTFVVSIGSGSPAYTLAMDGSRVADQGWVYRPQNLVIPNQQWRTAPPQMFTQDMLATTGSVQSANNPEGQLQAFGGQGIIDSRLPIEANLAVMADGSGLAGTVTNTSRWSLSDVTLVLGDNYLYLGNLPASESRPVTFPFKTRPNFLPRQGVEIGLYGSSAISTSTIPGNDTPERWERNLRWTMLNSAYLSGRFSSQFQSYGLYLTGWLEGGPATELMGSISLGEGKSLRQQDDLLLIKPLNFSYQPGAEPRIIIPASILTSFRYSATETTATTDGNIKMAANGSLVLQYRLPTQAALRPTRLSLFIKSGRDQRSAPQSSPQLEIYNWEQQKWEMISSLGDNRSRIDLTGPNLRACFKRVKVVSFRDGN